MNHNRLIVLLIMICFNMTVVTAQDLPPCGERDYIVDFPRVSPSVWCVELTLPADAPGDLKNASIAFDTDGTLFATNPYDGEVVAYFDSNGDDLPDTQRLVAEGLRYPHGLAIHNGILYVLGDGIIYTIDDGDVSILVDDLPGGRGFMARGILIHDNHLYIGMPSPCDYCVGENPLHGTVIRMNLDGTDREVIARGLRNPSGLEIYQGDLWVVDSARDAHQYSGTYYDEINRISLESDTVPHFGFPYCVGAENLPDYEADFDCASATPPEITVLSGSNPRALHRFQYEVAGVMRDQLLVVLSGAGTSGGTIAGHLVFSVEITESSYVFDTIVPSDVRFDYIPPQFETENGFNIPFLNASSVNDEGSGIFPHYLFDVATNEYGWLFVSIQGRGIYVLRQR